jgi:hypothetical protein
LAASCIPLGKMCKKHSKLLEKNMGTFFTCTSGNCMFDINCSFLQKHYVRTYNIRMYTLDFFLIRFLTFQNVFTNGVCKLHLGAKSGFPPLLLNRNKVFHNHRHKDYTVTNIMNYDAYAKMHHNFRMPQSPTLLSDLCPGTTSYKCTRLGTTEVYH